MHVFSKIRTRYIQIQFTFTKAPQNYYIIMTPGRGRRCGGWECLQVHSYFKFPLLQGVIIASCFVDHLSKEWLPSLLPCTTELRRNFPLSPTFSRLSHLPQPCFIQLRLLTICWLFNGLFPACLSHTSGSKTGQSIGAAASQPDRGEWQLWAAWPGLSARCSSSLLSSSSVSRTWQSRTDWSITAHHLHYGAVTSFSAPLYLSIYLLFVY